MTSALRLLVLPSTSEVADLPQRCARWAAATGAQVEVAAPGSPAALAGRLRDAVSDGFDGVVLERTGDPSPLVDAVEAATIPVVAVSRDYVADRSGPLDRACVRVIHGRGRGGFRWALQHLHARAAGPWREWAYGDGPDQVGDLRVPPATQPAPLAVMFHGGFWREEWERDLMDAAAVDLTRRGWITWNVEYRRAMAGWQASLDDATAVVTAIDRLPAPVDAARVVLLGHSAGAQLALCAAASRRHTVVGLAPLTDLAAAARDGVGWGSVTDFFGDPDRHPDHYRKASPAARLPLGLPQVFVHGRGDRHVPAVMTRAYVQAARQAGDHASLREVPDTDHFQIIDPAHGSWASVRAALDSRVG